MVAGQSTDPIPEGSSLSSSESDLPVVAKKSAFGLLREDSSSSSSEEEPAVIECEDSRPFVPAIKSAPLHRGRVRKPVPAPVVAKKKIVSVLDPCLEIDIHALNPSSELRRILGKSGGVVVRGKRVIKRRHWLIEPEKDWPLVVSDVFRMELCVDGSHRLVPECDYELKLKTLVRIVLTHDVEALYQFVQFNPFHPHGLVQLASIMIEQRGEFENALALVKRAIFAIQSAFPSTFHPNKRLLLSQDSIFSTIVFRALLLYMHLLAGQGCVRTALEVAKLIYQMEGGLGTGCPQTHILLHLDGLALKSDQFDWLNQFVANSGLTNILPNFAISFALGRKLADSQNDDQISPKRKTLSVDSTPREALLHVLVYFPGIIRAIIGRDSIPHTKRETNNLTNKLIQVWLIKNIQWIKANEMLVVWIKDVVDNVWPGWAKEQAVGTCEWLTRGYGNITTSEMEWGKASKGFVEPAAILENEMHVLDVYSEEGPVVSPNLPRWSPDQPVSLESNPIAAFLQTLLPWSRVDLHGTEAQPLTVARLWESLRPRAGDDASSADGEHEPPNDTQHEAPPE